MSSESDYYAGLISGADIQTGSRYFEAGTYLVQIDEVKIFKNRKRQPRACVECTILKSNNPVLGVSSSVSWIVSLDSDSGPSTIKTWIAKVFETPQREITHEAVQRIIPTEDSGATSPAVGLHCLVNAYEKPTKAGGIFTKCEWKRMIDGRDVLPDFTPAPPRTARPVEESKEDEGWDSLKEDEDIAEFVHRSQHNQIPPKGMRGNSSPY